MKVTNQTGPAYSFLEDSWSHGPAPMCNAPSGSATLRGLPYPIGGRISRVSAEASAQEGAATFYPEFAVARERDPPKRVLEFSELLHQVLARFW